MNRIIRTKFKFVENFYRGVLYFSLQNTMQYLRVSLPARQIRVTTTINQMVIY